MRKDKIRIYILLILLLTSLLLVLFVGNTSISHIVLAIVTWVFFSVAYIMIPKRSGHSYLKHEVLMLVFFATLLAIMFYYLSGLKYGFYSSPVKVIFLWKYILPYTVAIVSGECIRSIMLQQKDTFVNTIIFISMVLLDILIFTRMDVLSTFSNFREFVSMILFPAITGNSLCHYLSEKYGFLPNTVYRVSMAIYPYVLPIVPKTPEAMVAFGKLIFPILIFILIHNLYVRRKFVKSKRTSLAQVLCGMTLVTVMTLIIMLISCQFQYGLLVVGSESMTGTIDKGDAVIYERYEEQIVKVGDIAVFENNNVLYIHRVVDISHIDGKLRYFTKGDANNSWDEGYVTNERLVGLVRSQIKYIGYPTIWLREAFQ